MADALLLLDLERGNRPLSRVLMAVDGRAATVDGLVTLPDDRALVWVQTPRGRIAHLLATLRKVIGVRDVALVDQAVPRIGVIKHRVHTTDTVDVTVELAVEGVHHVGAGDGPTLYRATRRAVANCLGASCGEDGWVTTDPRSGAALAVVRTDQGVHACTGPTPESASLAAVLAVVPRGASTWSAASELRRQTA